MRAIGKVLGIPLGFLMFGCYLLSGNYGIAVILFSLLTKIIFMPLSISSQKNSIRLLQMQPKLDEINRRYSGDKEKIYEEQNELYQREKYKPLMSLVPLLVQLVMILGMVNVVYNPLTHLLHMDASVIEALSQVTRGLLGQENLGVAEQLHVLNAFHDPANLAAFTAGVPGLEAWVPQLEKLNLTFLGLNLGMTPSLANPSSLLFVPLVSGLSSLALCLIQNKLSPAVQQQGFFAKWGMTIFLVAFSVYFPLVMPAGVGLYWICSNVFGIFVALLMNAMYNPKKLVAPEVLARAPKLSRAEQAQKKAEENALKAREKADYDRFFGQKDPKKLMFYSVSSGQYKYFQTIIEYLLAHSDIPIHYVTSDPEDKIFKLNNPRLTPYYIGPKKIISFMMKVDADMVAMTVPDLQKYHIKRSIVRDDIEYLYIFHTVASMHMTLREGAVDNYDTVFCVGPHHVREIRQTEKVYGLKAKKLVKCGYGVIDMLMEDYKAMPPKQGAAPQILVAPSWQADNILDSCVDDIIEQLGGKGYTLIIRPHPEYIKRFPEKMQALIDKYDGKVEGLRFGLDFQENASIYQSDILMTDWSNIAFEFAYCTQKPAIFINTEMKVMNPEYQRLGIEPLDITLRDKVGVSVDPKDLSGLRPLVEEMLGAKDRYREEIAKTVEEYLYYPGRSGEAGGRYIIGRLAGGPAEEGSQR